MTGHADKQVHARGRSEDRSRIDHDITGIQRHGRQDRPAVLDVIGQGGGQPLMPDIRDEMESRLRADFSDVRIHTDTRAAESAAAMSAQAYTVGHEIVFASGSFAPASPRGKHWLAHELAHVQQQRRGSVAGTDTGTGVTVSDPSDCFERAAEATASQAMSGPVPAVAYDRTPRNATAAQGLTRPFSVQRFQPGEKGHGGIEAEGLLAAGLQGTMTGGEIGGIYLGNWMRDFSQLGDVHDPGIMLVLNVLSMGEFGRRVTPEQVGGYLASEHLDNPMGGGSAEDPSLNAPLTAQAAGARAAAEKRLSDDQRRWLDEQRNDTNFRREIHDRAESSHLPEYIEVGKEHARRKIEESARLAWQGKRSDAALALGNALHTIEDYYAHSNFADAGLYMLIADGSLPASHPIATSERARAVRFHYDPSGGTSGQSSTAPRIMTGTYRPANQKVSLLDALRTEIQTGALRHAAIKGAWAMQPELGVGALGLAAGVAKGWRDGRGVVGTVKSMAREGSSGARQAIAQGSETYGTEFLGADQGLGSEFDRPDAAAAVTAVVGLVDVLIASCGKTALPLLEGAADVETLKARHADALAREANPADTDTGPNHSQLAKDDTEHPLFGMARALAIEADRGIGTAIRIAWSQPNDMAALKAAADLVDVYVCNPADKSWWRNILIGQAYPAKPAASLRPGAPAP